MHAFNPPDDEIRALLKRAKTIAVVGCSPKTNRASHQIAQFLLEHGYRVIPVHPAADTILGQQVYPDLRAIAETVDIVDVFRRSEYTPVIAREAVGIGASALWLQQGIVHNGSWKIVPPKVGWSA